MTSGIFATALTAVLSLALLGSAAAAAFAPGETSLAADHGDTTRLEEVLNGLVDDGILSAELRDAILAKVAEAAHDEEDEDQDEDEDEDGSDNGKNKRDLDPKLRFDVHRLIGGWQQVVMEYLGLERRELMERLRAGETLAEIADDLEGKTAAGLIEALETPAFAKVDALVENEKLTEEQGEKAKERVTEAIEKILEREFPAKPKAERAAKPEHASSGNKIERESRKPAHANPGKRP